MRPTTLILQPIHNSSADILKRFVEGKALSPEQHHFLDWHQKKLSNAWYDPILRYYLHTRHPHEYHGTFLLPHEEMNLEAVQALKKRIQATLKNRSSRAVINVTPKQFLQFKEYTIGNLIFWHGNQFLTGAPFYPGGTPPVIYFQWGNFFGIVKYVVLAGEKELKANILIYFEDLQDRDLDRCVADYNHQLEQNIQLQKTLAQEKNKPQPQEEPRVITHTPQLMPSNYFLIHPLP